MLSVTTAVYQPGGQNESWIGAGAIVGPQPQQAYAATERTPYDAGDFYWHFSEQVPLRRLNDQLIVSLRSSADKQNILNSLSMPRKDATALSGVVSSLNDKMLLVTRGPSNGGGSLGAQDWLDSLQGVDWIAPAFVGSNASSSLLLTGEIVVALKVGVDPEDFFREGFGSWERFFDNQYVATISDGGLNPLEKANQLALDSRVEWASPDFYSDFKLDSTPNDSLFTSQWTFNNTGQTGATPGDDADVDMPEAWEVTTGSDQIVIAVLDNGVDTLHPDLNMFVNLGEIPNNGIDDDGNGYKDDTQGWDFAGDAGMAGAFPDRNANPTTAYDNHGTAVAGVAGAVGNNGTGVSGAAQNVKIMPIKIARSDTSTSASFVPYTDLAKAVYYAAGIVIDSNGMPTGATWDAADVLVSSWSLGSANSILSKAFDHIQSHGRNGRGVASFNSAGNDADGTNDSPAYRTFGLTGIPTGNYVFEWRYEKDSSGSQGDDRVWLGDIRFPNGAVQRFDSATMPVGWSTSGNASWQIVDDPAHSYGTGRYIARSGAITHNQVTRIRSPQITVGSTGVLQYSAWVSSQVGDSLKLYVSLDNGGTFSPAYFSTSGVPTVNSQVAYPASLASTIAVGASTDWNYRSAYSQYGASLDFVAPSSGGYGGVYTTDRIDDAGSNTLTDAETTDPDYTANFGGTSAAAPLAAGIAALMLSNNPNLKASDIRAIMRKTTDKIGGNNGQAAYVDNFNQYYGYGKVNAANAVRNLSVTGVSIAGPNALDGVYSIPTGNGLKQLQSVPIGGANKITIEFSSPLNTSSLNINGKLTLQNKQGGAATVVGNPTVVPGSNNTKLTWTLGATLPAGAYRITLADTIQNAAGVRLDGEFTNPVGTNTAVTSQLPSGNGSPLGAFNFDFVYLSADSNRDNKVDGADLIVWKNNFGGPSQVFGTGDATGDGAVNGVDFLVWQSQFTKNFTNLSLANAETTSFATVAGVTIGGSGSNHVAYAVPTGSGEQLRTIPVGGADMISLTFTADVSLVGDELLVYGADSGTHYGVVFEGYDALTYTATWRVASGALPPEQLVIKLTDGVVDGSSTPLDGDWLNPNSLASNDDYLRDLSVTGAGDGIASGAFEFHVSILPGDFNLDNKVDQDDVALQSVNLGMSAGAVFADGDFDGDGDVDGDDEDALYAVVLATLDYTTFADIVAPRVTSVWFDGSNSVHAPYLVPTGSGEQLRTVPMGGVDTIKLTFDEWVDLDGTELTAYGVTTATAYSLDFIGYSYGVATWRLASSAVFPAEQLLLRLDDSIVDGAGNALDGEFTNPWTLVDPAGSSTTLPSGDGVAGGDFRFRATILPSDFDRDNDVDSADAAIRTANSGSVTALHQHGDTDGDGDVDGSDFLKMQTQFGFNLTNWKSIEPGMILVSSAADEGDDSDYSIGDVTLRESLARAYAQAGDDVIVFHHSLGGQTINLSLGALAINSNVAIRGLGADASTVFAGGASRVMSVSSGVTAAISGLAITGGSVNGDGAGIYNASGNLTLSGVVVTANNATGTSGLGGGLFSTGGSVTVIDSEFHDNAANRGGAIRTQYGTTLTISGSAFYNNAASNIEGALSTHQTTALIENSTFSGNSAVNGGGAIRTNGTGQMTIVNSTIAYNTTMGYGGGIQVTGTGTVTLHNTILAANTAGASAYHDVIGALSAASSYNLIGQVGGSGLTNNVNGNKVGTATVLIDPMLAALGDYGGNTKTHALLQGSLAIDAGSNEEADGLLLDQRRRARLVDGDDDGDLRVDIGAYEVEYDEFFASLGA